MTPKRNKHPMALALFSLSSALLVGHAIYHYAILPDRMATHFSAAGEADAWGAKTAVFTWYFVITGTMLVLFGILKRVLSPAGGSWIRIPNRSYWLAPERAEETLAYLRKGLLLFGSGTLLLVLDIMHQAFAVSLGEATKLTHIGGSIAIYTAFCIAWIGAIYRRFAKTA